jgi:hypothetical protein
MTSLIKIFGASYCSNGEGASCSDTGCPQLVRFQLQLGPRLVQFSDLEKNCTTQVELKLLHISYAVSICFGTEIEIWADFRLVGSNEKKNGLIMSNF